MDQDATTNGNGRARVATAEKPPKQARVIPPGASPISGVVPPPEHRFKPGQSGNPKGARREPQITPRIQRMLMQGPQSLTGPPRTNAEAVARALLRMATDGENVQAVKELLDRTEGKVVDRIIHEQPEVILEWGDDAHE